jgi:hypothetical protein
MVVGACSVVDPSATRTGSPAFSLQPTVHPSPTVIAMDLTAVVISPESPPPGRTLSDDGQGRAVLEQLPLSPDTAAELLAAPGFVDGRWSRFDFEASKGFVLTWVAQYAAPKDATEVFSISLNELQSDDHYGWGIGEDAGLGDQGTCLEGDNPQLGGLHETICLWRHGPLVMVVGGGSENETPIQVDAEAMDARADALISSAPRLIAADLPEIVITPTTLPDGMTIDDQLSGLDALIQPLMLLEETAFAVQPGFVDARMTRVGTSGPGSYWEEGGYVTWAALYETAQLASDAMDVLVSEHESASGWGLERVGPAPFGDEGVHLQGAAYGFEENLLFVWRVDNVVLAALAIGVTATGDSAAAGHLAIAQAMDDRVREVRDT